MGFANTQIQTVFPLKMENVILAPVDIMPVFKENALSYQQTVNLVMLLLKVHVLNATQVMHFNKLDLANKLFSKLQFQTVPWFKTIFAKVVIQGII